MAKKAKTFSYKKLQEAVDALNEMEIFEELIDLTEYESTDEQVEVYLQVVEKVDDEGEDIVLPEIVIDLYNAFADAQDNKQVIVFSDKVKEKSAEKEKPEKQAKQKGSKKAKKAPEKAEKEKAEPESKKKKKTQEKATEKAKKSKPVKTKKTEPKTEKTEKTSEPKKDKKKDGKTEKVRKEIQKDVLGARVGSGTSKINEMLLEGADVKDIAKKIDTPLGRVKNHVYALMKREDKNYEIKKKDDFVKVILAK